jgi:hypothetical protein
LASPPSAEKPRAFHKPCFTCHTCSTALGDGGHFSNEAGELLCPTCANGLEPQQGETCAGCGTTIIGDAIRALDAYHHPACFMCAGCGAAIGEAEFLITPRRHPCHQDCKEAALAKEQSESKPESDEPKSEPKSEPEPEPKSESAPVAAAAAQDPPAPAAESAETESAAPPAEPVQE